MLIYAWFQETYYEQTKRKISLPSNTDPTKTYQYRWVKSFAEKVERWGLTEKEIKFLITEVIKYSRRNNLLSRGVGVLSKADILDECMRAIEGQQKKMKGFVEEVKANHAFFTKNKNKATTLLGKLVNFTHWYRQGKLCKEYVALSKPCISIINDLDEFNRSFVPTLRELVLVRLRCLADARDQLRNILGEDLKNES